MDDKTSPASQDLLRRMDGKLDSLQTDVADIKVQVATRDTYCAAEHRRVDERAAEDRARIIATEAAQRGAQLGVRVATARAWGIWRAVGVIGAALVAGGGLVLGALRLWGR